MLWPKRILILLMLFLTVSTVESTLADAFPGLMARAVNALRGWPVFRPVFPGVGSLIAAILLWALPDRKSVFVVSGISITWLLVSLAANHQSGGFPRFLRLTSAFAACAVLILLVWHLVGTPGQSVAKRDRSNSDHRVNADAKPLTLMKGKLAESVSLSAPTEAYRKHSTELSAIEDRQNKMILLLLGILSAAGTLLNNQCPDPAVVWYIAFVAIVIVSMGHHANNELADLRKASRDLLVRCETALGYYSKDIFTNGKALYTDYENGYARRGGWLKRYFSIVWLVLAGFLILLASHSKTCPAPPVK
jgi:hypothetical protein